MKLAARLAYTPMQYESEPGHVAAGPVKRHRWKRWLACVYCLDCKLAARVYDDGRMVGIDGKGNERPYILVDQCGGGRAANIRKRRR